MNLLKKETVIEIDAGLLQKKCFKKILAGILCCGLGEFSESVTQPAMPV